VRDVIYCENASQTRTGNGPQVMATLRNLAIRIMKLARHTSIAAAYRHHARDATRTLMSTPRTQPSITKTDVMPPCRGPCWRLLETRPAAPKIRETPSKGCTSRCSDRLR